MLSIPVLAIGSAKVSRSFNLASERGSLFCFVRFAGGEEHSVRVVRGAKVIPYSDFQAPVATFYGSNPVDLLGRESG